MTWEELVEKVKTLGYSLKEGDVFDVLGKCGKYQYLEKNDGNILFMNSGKIETLSDILAENRTYEQMYQIMLALR